MSAFRAPHRRRQRRQTQPRFITRREVDLQRELEDLIGSDADSESEREIQEDRPRRVHTRSTRGGKKSIIQESSPSEENEDEDEDEESPNFAADADSEDEDEPANSKSKMELKTKTKMKTKANDSKRVKSDVINVDDSRSESDNPPSSQNQNNKSSPKRRRPRRKAAPLVFHDALEFVVPGSATARQARAAAEARRLGIPENEVDASIPSYRYSSQSQSLNNSSRKNRDGEVVAAALRRPAVVVNESNECETRLPVNNMPRSEWSGPQPQQWKAVRNMVYRDVWRLRELCSHYPASRKWNIKSVCAATGMDAPGFKILQRISQIIGFRIVLKRANSGFQTGGMLLIVETRDVASVGRFDKVEIKNVVGRASKEVFDRTDVAQLKWVDIEREARYESDDRENGNESDSSHGSDSGNGIASDARGMINRNFPVSPNRGRTEAPTVVPSVNFNDDFVLPSNEDSDDDDEIIPVNNGNVRSNGIINKEIPQSPQMETDVPTVILPTTTSNVNSNDVLVIDGDNNDGESNMTNNENNKEDVDISRWRETLLKEVKEFSQRCIDRQSQRVVHRFDGKAALPAVRAVARELGVSAKTRGKMVEFVKDRGNVMSLSDVHINRAVDNAILQWRQLHRVNEATGATVKRGRGEASGSVEMEPQTSRRRL